MGERRQLRLPGTRSAGRRRFLKWAAGWLGALVTALLSVPLVWFLVDRIYRLSPLRYTRVGSVASLPTGQPKSLSFTLTQQEAYLVEEAVHDVWVIRHSATDVTVFSPICPHAGCHYDWHPQRHEFICPCHGSIFSITGKVLGGPAPRPLDALPHKVTDGVLYVEWERFKVGIRQKVRV